MTTSTATKTETFSREAYVEKVRKLLAKAEGAATQEEADSFFAKAQDLMTKWEIEEAETRSAGTTQISWKIESRVYTLSSYSPNQDSIAMQRVAEGMGLKAYQTRYVRGYAAATTVVFGTAEDLDRYDMMWTSVSIQMARAMRNDENPKWNRNQQRTFRLGFKVGYGNRIGERLTAARSKSTGKSLVLVGKSDAIEVAMPETVSRAIKTDAAASAAGRAAADRADLNGSARVNGAKAKALK